MSCQLPLKCLKSWTCGKRAGFPVITRLRRPASTAGLSRSGKAVRQRFWVARGALTGIRGYRFRHQNPKAYVSRSFKSEPFRRQPPFLGAELRCEQLLVRGDTRTHALFSDEFRRTCPPSSPESNDTQLQHSRPLSGLKNIPENAVALMYQRVERVWANLTDWNLACFSHYKSK